MDGPELSGERGAVFEGLELCLAVGIVIRDVGPGVALCDVQVGEQRGDGFGGHRGAAVGVDGSGRDPAVADDGVLDECLGEVGVFGDVHLPSHRLAGEDIEHDVQIEVVPPPRSFEPRDIPRPHLVGAVGDELGTDAGRVGGLGASLADLPFGPQHPVHGGDAGQVGAVVDRTAQTWAGDLSANLSSLRTASRAARSVSVSAHDGAGRAVGGGVSGVGSGWRCRCRVALDFPSSRHAALVEMNGSNSVSAASITRSASGRSPRSRRASPRARRLFPRYPVPPLSG